MGDPKQESFTILSSDADGYSSAIDMLGYSIGGFYIPQMTATTAYLYFESSEDGTTYDPVYYGADRLMVPVSTSDAIRQQVLPSMYTEFRYLRVQAVTAAGVGVQQGANVAIKPKCKEYR